MKKAITLLVIVFAMLLSLVACGTEKSEQITTTPKEAPEIVATTQASFSTNDIIGTWIVKAGTKKEDNTVFFTVFELFKGGTAKLYSNYDMYKSGSHYNATWVIKEDCVIITQPYLDNTLTYAFEILDKDTLKPTDGGVEFNKSKN